MGLVEYAKNELDLIEKDEDGLQEMMNRDILEIIEKFADQGHTGMSASYAIAKIERLMRFKPLKPLTGEADEWNEVGTIVDHLPKPFPRTIADFRGVKQNKRCSSVFLDKDGKAHDNDAYIVTDNGGITWFHSGQFLKYITFPYYPPTEPEKIYIEYNEDGKDFDIITDDKERIQALYKRKRKEFDEAMAD